MGRRLLFYGARTTNGLSLVASEKSHLKRLLATLNFLQATDAIEFSNVTTNLKAVIIAPIRGDGGFVRTAEGVFITLSNQVDGKRFTGSNKIWLASDLIHEARHVWRYITRTEAASPRERETDACQPQLEYLRKLCALTIIEKIETALEAGWWSRQGNYPSNAPEYRSLNRIVSRYLESKLEIQWIKEENLSD